MSDADARQDISRPLGHVAVVERLGRLAEAGTRSSRTDRTHGIPHALLFDGPEGVGKFKTAVWWASRIKCDLQGDGASASSAGSCHCASCRQVAVGSHPDVLVVAPEAAGKMIKIEPIREALIPTLSLRPVRPGPRIAIVREAESLNVHAQNAMLKVLEEPPGNAVIILVTGSRSALLPTIRSRCQTIRFGPLEPEALETILTARGFTPEHARSAGATARGSVGRALECDEETLADRVDLILAFEGFRSGTGPSMDELVADLVDRRKTERAELPVLLEWQLRKIETAYGCHAAVESDRLAPLMEQAVSERPEQLINDAARTRTAIRHLERNANRKLALRDMLLDIRP
jgi:DNA polymerase-3 subunit delta'